MYMQKERVTGMSSLVADLFGEKERNEEREAAFWSGFSRFQVPDSILRYKGNAPAQVYMLLFRVACSISYHSKRTQQLEVSKPHSFICHQTKLSERAVERAVKTLERDGLIIIIPREQKIVSRKADGTYIRNSIVLLHPETREPLYTLPGSYSVCYRNMVTPYLTVPRAHEDRLYEMQRSGRAVGLSALSEASERQQLSFVSRKSDLKEKSGLGRNHFELGLSECEREKLLTYAKNIVTMLDPLTGKQANRQPREFINHEDPNWKFDLDTVTPEHWRAVIKRLMPRREFYEGSDGWTFTTGHPCPFCKKERAFSIHFGKLEEPQKHAAVYKCHAGKTEKCGGNLGQLVRRLLRCSMAEAKAHIQDITGQKAEVAQIGAEHAHAGI
jgi:hypothetical protein